MSIIGIDFYGTLSENAGFWQEFMKFLLTEGHKIIVISGPWPTDLEVKLEDSGYKKKVHWNDVISLLDYLNRAGVGVWYDDEQDSWYSQEAPWWEAKAKICKHLGIQIHLDSDSRFSPAFADVATRFVNTDSPGGKEFIRKWYNQLKVNNTYEDWGDDNSWGCMMGIVPM